VSPLVSRPQNESIGALLPTLTDPPGAIQVAILDAQESYAAELADFLRDQGFGPAILADSTALLQRTIDGPLDLIIMDLKFGAENGLDLLRRIRSVSNIPCVVLSAALCELDRVLALEMGADHFLSKSLTHREVLAHLRALLRRSIFVASSLARPGGWRIMPEQREVLRPDGVPCGLTSAEFDILQFLAAATGKAVSRDDISKQVFSRPYRVGDRTVDMLITRLRRKIERDADSPRMIKTVRAVGYSFAGFLADTE